MIEIPPACIYLLGLLIVPLIPGVFRKVWTLLIGAVGVLLVLLLNLASPGVILEIIPGIETILLTVDPMRQLAGIIFALAGFITLIYASYRDLPALETTGILASIAAAMGIVYAGDLITVFVFWELLALASLAIIWSSEDPKSSGAGYRYLLFHIFGGACLLGGIVYTIATTGSAAFGSVGDGFGVVLMLIGIGVNAAFIPLHTWVPDAYPRASVVGSVALCIFTTKAAVFLLAAIGGWGLTVAYMGGAMALYGAIYALMQDDIRRLLAYSIISQGGYMVAAIGVGTVAGLDAGLAHMVNDILFKSLLFMAAGAVILRTGHHRLSELGGLSGMMPKTTLCAVIGGLALAGLPGLNGAVSKGMVIEAAGSVPYLSLILLVSAVITVIYVSRLLYFVFFRSAHGTKEGIIPEDAPAPMLVAMGITALLCLIIGLLPDLLTNLLPGGTHAHPFSPSHLPESVAIFALAGIVLLLVRSLRSPGRGFETDIDSFYIALGRGVTWIAADPLVRGAEGIGKGIECLATFLRVVVANPPVACQIGMKTLALPVMRAFSSPSTSKVYEDTLMEMKARYPDDQINIWGGGYGIIFISIIAFLYFIFDILK
ncbi:proton-conducting transporter membrane subunit [Methanocalculus sp.]|uniref:proton-conducting transporter transmembrane domain-containing protein n=1 Tax=Methanocalculus sp. TaxID=2004547 RepID=UPI002728B6A1|nr:proton-conducting transporter membrane subunit [Methanocalculus sp.]MDO8841947.1 proton-conducting transporter membrane subunit [Methanocalculus sp.]